MSMRTKNQQRITWEKGKGFIPIVDSVSIMADISNIHENKHDSHGLHFNLHEYLESLEPNTHKTLPIDNTHVGMEAYQKAVEFGLKLAGEQKKPFMVDRDSRIYKAFDKAVNPLWTNELTEDPLKRNMRSEIGGHTYKPEFNKPSFGSLPKPSLNPFENGIKIGGYDMGERRLDNRPALTIPVPSNMSVADAYRIANGNMTIKEAYRIAEEKSRGVGTGGIPPTNPWDRNGWERRKNGVVWRPVTY